MIENGQRISMSPHCPILGTPGDGWERGHNIVAVAVLHHTFHAPRVSQSSLKTLAKLSHSFQQILLPFGGFGVKNLISWLTKLNVSPTLWQLSVNQSCLSTHGFGVLQTKKNHMLHPPRPIYFYPEVFLLLSHAQCFNPANLFLSRNIFTPVPCSML